MQRRKNKEIKLIFTVLAVFFLAFLAVPMVQVIVKSLTQDTAGIGLENYRGSSYKQGIYAGGREQFPGGRMQRAGNNASCFCPCLYSALHKPWQTL